MDLETRHLDGTTVVVVRGELDNETSPRLRAEMELIAGSQVSELVIDVSGVTFISSAGLNALIAGQQAQTQGEGAFRVLSGNRAVDRLIALTGLDYLYG